jgi:hypothetical protein
MIETQNHFLAQSRENIGKIQNEITALRSTPVKDEYSWIFAWFHLCYLVFGGFILWKFSSEENFHSLVGWLVGLLAVVLLLWWIPRTDEYKKWRIMSAINSYNQKKIKMERIYSSVVSDMNIDFRDSFIAPTKIMDIEMWVHNLSNEIIDIYKSYKWVILIEKSIKSFTGKKTKSSYQDFLTQEWLWLTEYITSFSRDLDTWMTRHHSELVQLQSSVGAQARTMDIVEWKAALGITEERISRLSEEIPLRVK